jgi:hypothetical protein
VDISNLSGICYLSLVSYAGFVDKGVDGFIKKREEIQ